MSTPIRILQNKVGLSEYLTLTIYNELQLSADELPLPMDGYDLYHYFFKRLTEGAHDLNNNFIQDAGLLIFVVENALSEIDWDEMAYQLNTRNNKY